MYFLWRAPNYTSKLAQTRRYWPVHLFSDEILVPKRYNRQEVIPASSSYLATSLLGYCHPTDLHALFSKEIPIFEYIHIYIYVSEKKRKGSNSHIEEPVKGVPRLYILSVQPSFFDDGMWQRLSSGEWRRGREPRHSFINAADESCSGAKIFHLLHQATPKARYCNPSQI